MSKIQTLDELMQEEEARLTAEANTPERLAKDAAIAERSRVKAEAEFQRAVARGDIDAEGNSLLAPDEDEDEEGEDDDSVY